jgi:hypothetical protein
MRGAKAVRWAELSWKEVGEKMFGRKEQGGRWSERVKRMRAVERNAIGHKL